MKLLTSIFLIATVLLAVYGIYQGLQPGPMNVEIEILSTPPPPTQAPPKTAYITGVNEDGTFVTATKEEYDRYWAEKEQEED